jgi:voltage-gated potassium channel
MDHAQRSAVWLVRRGSPLRAIWVRLFAAAGAVLITTFVVAIDTDGYTDNADGVVSLLDALYYATVSVTTTGYGDITPVTDLARAVTTWVVTPLRAVFLISVVSTTIEVLATTTGELWRVQRWRRNMKQHYVIIGYGTKGRAAATVLRSQGVGAERIVVVESDTRACAEAVRDGYVAVNGEGTRDRILLEAGVNHAHGVIVAVNADATAVLATLTARRLSPDARITAAVRENETKQSIETVADLVVVSDEASGQMLGLGIDRHDQTRLIDDLLRVGAGLEINERDVATSEIGSVAPLGTICIVRGTEELAPQGVELRAGDRLLYVRGTHA